MEKSIIIISRKWKNPEIEVFVDNKEIGSKMKLSSFIEALVEEAGNPSLLFTKAKLLEKLLAASKEIEQDMKEGTRHL